MYNLKCFTEKVHMNMIIKLSSQNRRILFSFSIQIFDVGNWKKRDVSQCVQFHSQGNRAGTLPPPRYDPGHIT